MYEQRVLGYATSTTLAMAIALLAATSAQGVTMNQTKAPCSPVISLDGQWLLATDAKNVGQAEKWWTAPRPDAKPTKVPWIIQDAFPGYHGVAWYWKEFEAPANPHPDGRTDRLA
jgi:hypothetical protein